MQEQQPTPDALVSFSDFLLERFGLVASMQVAVVTSVAVHAFVIVGFGFQVPDWRSLAAPHNVLDVVLVNARSAAKPTKADALAQANLDGGGNTDEKLRASSPFPVMESKESTRDPREAEARVRALEREAKQLMTQLKSQAQVAQATADSKADEKARELVEKSLEIQRLEAQIKRDHKAYQERPRKTFIGARAEESRFAVYIDNWRQRVERIGNLNYPDEARQKRIHGTLQLTVAIRANGEVESIEVHKRSGSKILDQAAIRIVRLGAPYDRLPDNIRADTDILYITRTWIFTRSDQIETE